MEENFSLHGSAPVSENFQTVRTQVNLKVIVFSLIFGLLVIFVGVYTAHKYVASDNNVSESPAPSDSPEIASTVTGQTFVPGNGSVYSELAPPAFRNRVLFLKNGEVWSSQAEGDELTQLTHTNQRVTYYAVSPGLMYIAFEEYADVQNEIHNDVSIMDLRSGQVFKKETDTGLLSLENGEWFSDSALYLGSRDLMGTPSQPYIIHIEGAPSIDYPPIYGSNDLESHRLLAYGIDDAKDTRHYYENIQLNGQTIFYIRVGGAADAADERTYSQEFYLLDTTTRENILVASLETTANSFITNARINHKGNEFAYITSDASNTSFRYGDRGSKVFLHPGKLLFDYSSQPPGVYVRSDYVSVSDLRWSFDDRYVSFRIGDRTCCVNTDKDQLVLIDVSNPDSIRIIDDVNHSDLRPIFFPETRYQWTRDGTILFERDDGLYMYDPVSDTENIFSDKSSYPFVF